MKKLISIILSLLIMTSITAQAQYVEYTSMEVPNYNSSFKAWEDYRCITDKSSDNYKFINQWGWVDGDGFLRCDGERDFGINDDYYIVAMGSYYATEIGTKFRITTDTGRVFYVALGDQKADRDTNSTHQWGNGNKDIVEFLVHIPSLVREVKVMGSANVYMHLNGSITKIEKMEFTY